MFTLCTLCTEKQVDGETINDTSDTGSIIVASIERSKESQELTLLTTVMEE